MQISFSVEEVTKMTGLGRTKIYEALQSGELKARKFGKRTIILKDDLNKFLDNLKPFQQTQTKF